MCTSDLAMQTLFSGSRFHGGAAAEGPEVSQGMVVLSGRAVMTASSICFRDHVLKSII